MEVFAADIPIGWDKGIALVLVVSALVWVAKSIIIPWRDGVLDRDKEIAKDNKLANEEKLELMKQMGADRQQLIGFCDDNTKALQKISERNKKVLEELKDLRSKLEQLEKNTKVS